MISPPEISGCVSEIDCQLRNPDTHFEQCALLYGPLQDHYSTSFGINRLSILEEVPGFSVVTGLPHDIMHDLFEGVVPYELKLLIKICTIALSPVCTYDTISFLRVLIEEKLELFKKLYPVNSMIPKQHYMVHYPSQISRLGPLIQSWNMRQESKLSFIKRVSRRSNYKNVCLTVAKKHQFWLCHQMVSSQLLTPTLDQSNKQLSCVLSEEEDYLQEECLRIMPTITQDAVVNHPHWVTLQSSLLRKGVYIVLSYDTFQPVFGKVVDIAVIEKTVLLCVLEFYGHVFNSHCNSFEISHRGVFKTLSH